jgi:SSS family solute:Na+ symporter
MNWELFGITVYVILMIALGLYFSRRIKNESDYYLGGRSLGPGLACFSIFATWFGAETCIGTAGAVYTYGLSSIHADPLGYSLCLLIMAIFFAKILWQKQITTIPDLLRARYSSTTEKLGALLMIPSSIIWAGAQVRALGQILHATTSFGPTTAVTIAAGVVIIYTMCGGLLADAYADFFQGIAIITGLVFLVLMLVIDLGGFGGVVSHLSFEKLSFSGGEFEGVSFLGQLELWLVPILGSLMAQELVSRVCASRSEKIARTSAFFAVGIYLIVGLIPVFIGLIGAHYFPALEDPETLMPVLARNHFNYFFYVLFIGALISAILSTVDTTLLASSSLLSQNLIFPALNNASSKRKVILARFCTLVAGVLSYTVAFFSDSIRGLVETASGLGGPIILVIVVAALWEKKGTSLSANLAISAGLITWLVGHFLFKIDFPVILTALISSLTYALTLPFVPVMEEEAEVEVRLG